MITIYHYTKCSKSRCALTYLDKNGQPYNTRFYLDNPLSKEELIALSKKINAPLINMVRTNESIYKELFGSNVPSDEQLLEAMVAHPILLQRPIVERDDEAIIARPPEKVFELLQ
ncbi:MAG: arsenate reductase family protein [Chitinophagales bacterium]|nr:arsenate reductase family protein [Chitinophagales bacterium]